MNELSLFEHGLVPVYKTDKGEYVVNGRELWSGLQSKQQFADWVKKRIMECDAVENEDFELIHKKMKNLEGGRPSKEYIIKLDTAKEMAMLERNEIGKKVRKYFIEIEKKSKQLITYQPKSTSIGEVTNLLKVLKSVMKDQNHLPQDIAQMTETICKQFNINLPDNFVKENPRQLLLIYLDK